MYNKLSVMKQYSFKIDSDVSNILLELLSINYYDIEMHKNFRDFIDILKEILALLTNCNHFFDFLENTKLLNVIF